MSKNRPVLLCTDVASLLFKTNTISGRSRTLKKKTKTQTQQSDEKKRKWQWKYRSDKAFFPCASSLKCVITACQLVDNSANVFLSSSPHVPLVFMQSYSTAVKVVTVNTSAHSAWLIQMTHKLQLCVKTALTAVKWNQTRKKKKKTWLEEQKSIQVKEKFMDYMKEYYLSNIL